MPRFSGVDSEVGRLRTVIVHRPGAELKRVIPASAGRLLFAELPWAARAQQEHDIFTQALRDHGVQVLYLTELLQDVLEYAPARQQAITAALGSAMLGDQLAGQVRCHLDGLDPEALAEALIVGLAAGEFRSGRGAVYQLLSPSDFILKPLPDLVFFRDPSVWIGDQVVVASPAVPGGGLAAELIGIVYAHHPLFAGTKSLYRPGLEPLHGGDLLLAAPGVIAAGCLPPGAERLARRVFDAGLAHTVLVVPLGHPDRRLDTACTMLSADTVLMRPATAYSLTARVLTPGGDGPRVSHPQAFLAARGRGGGPGPAAGGGDRVRARGREPRAVGRRRQPAGAGPGAGGVPRAQRGHPRQARAERLSR